MPGNNANMSPRLQAAREELNVAYDAYEAALAHYNEVLQAETGIPFTGPAADPQTPRTFLREIDADYGRHAAEGKRVAAEANALLKEHGYGSTRSAPPTGAAAYEEGGYRSIRRMRSRSRRVNKKKRKSRRVAK